MTSNKSDNTENKIYNKWVLYSLQNLLLVLNVVNMFAFDDLSLFHAFDGVFVIRLCFEPADANITEGT